MGKKVIRFFLRNGGSNYFCSQIRMKFRKLEYIISFFSVVRHRVDVGDPVRGVEVSKGLEGFGRTT